MAKFQKSTIITELYELLVYAQTLDNQENIISYDKNDKSTKSNEGFYTTLLNIDGKQIPLKNIRFDGSIEIPYTGIFITNDESNKKTHGSFQVSIGELDCVVYKSQLYGNLNGYEFMRFINAELLRLVLLHIATHKTPFSNSMLSIYSTVVKYHKKHEEKDLDITFIRGKMLKLQNKILEDYLTYSKPDRHFGNEYIENHNISNPDKPLDDVLINVLSSRKYPCSPFYEYNYLNGEEDKPFLRESPAICLKSKWDRVASKYDMFSVESINYVEDKENPTKIRLYKKPPQSNFDNKTNTYKNPTDEANLRAEKRGFELKELTLTNLLDSNIDNTKGFITVGTTLNYTLLHYDAISSFKIQIANLCIKPVESRNIDNREYAEDKISDASIFTRK